MVDKSRNSKLLGRPKELHEKTERLTFHLEKSNAEALRAYVTKDRKISAILRDAATEYLEKFQQEEAIGKLRREQKEFVELYDLAKGFRERPIDFAALIRIKDASKALLEYIATDFEVCRSAFVSHPDFFQPSGPPPQDKILAEASAINRELADQYRKSIFSVYHILLNYIAWIKDWNQRRRQFMDSLGKIIKEIESVEIKETPLPEIEFPEEKYKDRSNEKKGGNDL